MSFKLKMKVLLFLVSSVVSFSVQNENFQANIKNNDVNKKDEKMNFEQHVEVNYDSLTMSEKEMLQFIVQHKELIVSKTIVEVGELLLTSKSTVLRLAKKIGFRGFTDMRYSIQDSISKTKSVDKIDLLSQLQMDIQKTFRFATELDFLPILKMVFQMADKSHPPQGVILINE